MNKYKALTEMGVQNPEQIERFAMYTTDQADILRIFYKRKKGSILPVSKKYKFARIKKSTLVDSGTRQTQIIYESDPAFRHAVSELEQIMASKSSKQNLNSLIAEEIRLVEEDFASRIDYIKSLVKEL